MNCAVHQALAALYSVSAKSPGVASNPHGRHYVCVSGHVGKCPGCIWISADVMLTGEAPRGDPQLQEEMLRGHHTPRPALRYIVRRAATKRGRLSGEKFFMAIGYLRMLKCPREHPEHLTNPELLPRCVVYTAARVPPEKKSG